MTPTSDGSLIPLYCIFIGLAVIAVILRLVARVLTQAYFWWDDFSNLFGFVGCSTRVPDIPRLLTPIQDWLRGIHGRNHLRCVPLPTSPSPAAF